MKSLINTLLILAAPLAAFAQAPASINGAIFDMAISSGGGAFASHGWFTVIVGGGNTYEIRDEYNQVESSGTYTYSRSGSNPAQATVVLSDPAAGLAITATLNFSHPGQGSYSFSNQFGHQAGSFIAMLPNARGYPTIAMDTNLEAWIYFGPWPWAYMAGIGGWVYLWPEADGLYILPTFDFPTFCLVSPGA